MLALFIGGCTNDKNELPKPADGCEINAATITWDNTVHSIIQNNCSIAGCHVSLTDGGNGIDYTAYSAVKGKITSGVFQNRVFTLRNMPLQPVTLSSCDLSKLKAWVDNGAPQ